MSELGAQAFIQALSSMNHALKVKADLHAASKRMEHEHALFRGKADLMRDLVGAIVEKRTDAVKDGFSQILETYAEQARNYMKQKDRYDEQVLLTRDPAHFANLSRHIENINIELANIRKDAQSLYMTMTETVLAIGGDVFDPGSELGAGLNLQRIAAPHRG